MGVEQSGNFASFWRVQTKGNVYVPFPLTNLLTHVKLR
jgi:hypothetical protein